MTSESERLRDAMRALGPGYAQDIAAGSQAVKELYAPVLLARPREGIGIVRDVPYGAHARQVLDVYRPEGATGRSIVVFVHGGAFVRGAKAGPYGVYQNVLLWFARQGFVGVNVEYRLAPEAQHPQGALDVAAAMEWVHRHAGDIGGRADRILLMGHSAGGTHVAAYACDPALAAHPCLARALVLVSARLRADDLPQNPNAAAVRAYFGDDPADHAARSPVSHAARVVVPLFIAVAEHENPLLDVYGLEFAHRVARARGQAPRFLQCRGHNHMSIMAHFDSGEETLGREILEFWSGL